MNTVRDTIHCLHRLIAEAAAETPEADAVWWPGGRWDYARLDAESNHLARHLAHLGVGPGDRVGIWLDKSGHALAATQAVLRRGAIYVPIDPRTPAARAQTIMADCGMSAVVKIQKPSQLRSIQPAANGSPHHQRTIGNHRLPMSEHKVHSHQQQLLLAHGGEKPRPEKAEIRRQSQEEEQRMSQEQKSRQRPDPDHHSIAFGHQHRSQYSQNLVQTSMRSPNSSNLEKMESYN